METSITTTDRTNILAMAKSLRDGERPQQFPTLKMRNSKNPTSSVKKGEFYTSKIVDGKEDITPLGANPHVVILHRRYSYSYFNKETEKLEAFTNEIDGFHPNQKVDLTIIAPGGSKTLQSFMWPEFKQWKAQDEELGKKLTFKNIMYCVLGDPKPENVCRLFVSNASVTGVKDGEKTGDYKNPLLGSFTEFSKMFTYSGTEYCMSVCELGSQWLETNEYYLVTFKALMDNPETDECIALLGGLLKSFTPQKNVVIEPSEVHFGVPELVDSKDLPF